MIPDLQPSQNPFAILNLSADASYRAIRGVSQEAIIRGRLSIDDASSEPLASIERAAELLKDPVSRFAHSMFWVTLSDEELVRWRAHTVLSGLGSEWSASCVAAYEELAAPSELFYHTHNLAVLHLGTAVHLASTSAPEPECRAAWKSAFQYWSLFTSGSGCREQMQSNAQEIGDPRLSEAHIEMWERELPAYVLGFCQRSASKALLRGEIDRATSRVESMRNAAFPDHAINQALAEVYAPLCHRIQAKVGQLEERLEGNARKSDPKNGLPALLRDFKESCLPLLEMILVLGDLPGLEEERTRDQAARCLRTLSIAFHNEIEDQRSSLDCIEIGCKLADSQSVRDQLIEGRRVIEANANFRPVQEFVERGDFESAIRLVDEQLSKSSGAEKKSLREFRDLLASAYATKLFNEAMGCVKGSNLGRAKSLLEKALKWESSASDRAIIHDVLSKVSTAHSSSSCFVATATFGTPQHMTVHRLRVYRDLVLTRSLVGRSFIAVYWRVGPPLAWVVRRLPITRRILAPLLSFVAANLRHSGGK